MKKFYACLLMAAIIICMGGCAGKSVPQFNAQYYPDCYDPIDKLCKDQSYQQEIKETAGGALIGAATGALIGVLATGDWRGALAGGIAGGVAGGATGFFHAKYSKMKDQEQRLAQYQKDLGAEADRWDLERASVEKAYKCYREQIALLKQAWRNKQISKEAFLARANEIKAGVEHINTFWADAENRMNTTMLEGEKFLADEEKAAKDKLAVQRANRASSAKISQQRKANTTTNALKKSTVDELAQLNELVDTASGLAELFGDDPAFCVAGNLPLNAGGVWSRLA